MKYDLFLIKDILVRIDNKNDLSDLEVEGYSKGEIASHCKGLYEGNFISDCKPMYADNEVQEFAVGSLTDYGEKLLNALRDDSFLNGIKKYLKKSETGLTIDVLKSVVKVHGEFCF